MKVGLLGGSFNPVHLGHLVMAQAAHEQLGLDRVILMPAPRPPHKDPRELAPDRHRLAMARLAARGTPWLRVSDLEFRRRGPSYTIDTVEALVRRLPHRRERRGRRDSPFGPGCPHGVFAGSTTRGPATGRSRGRRPKGGDLRALCALCGESSGITLIVGQDTLGEIDTWRESRRLRRLVTIGVYRRPAFAGVPASVGKPGSRARSVNWIDGPRIDVSARDVRARVRTGRSIRFWVPLPVEKYIVAKGLYR